MTLDTFRHEPGNVQLPQLPHEYPGNPYDDPPKIGGTGPFPSGQVPARVPRPATMVLQMALLPDDRR